MDYSEKILLVTRGVEEAKKGLQQCKIYINWDDFVKQYEVLYRQTQNTNLWDDANNARVVLRDFSQMDELYKRIITYDSQCNDAHEMLELLTQEHDDVMMSDLQGTVSALTSGIRTLGYEVMLCEPEDRGGCYVAIQSGAGGTDAQDWAEMLMTMYLRWGGHHHKVVVEDYSEGEEAGIKGAVLRIDGRYAFGFLKTESGIHRLVRQSPFNSSGKRHTSFASVLVLPIVDDSITVVIQDKDLRIDTYRASGAGGQHVNKTDSAVRITHIPTGIVVQCQSERSQHRNKESAMHMLQSRLYAKQKQEQKEKEDSIEKKSISWGHQIRSYVLHPYRLVKDLRTNVEHQDPDKVLQGDIMDFLEASLAQKVPVVYSN